MRLWMELQRFVGRGMCRFVTCWHWGKGIASEAEAEGGTDQNRETPRELGEEGLLVEEAAGQISIGGESGRLRTYKWRTARVLYTCYCY